MHKTTVFVIDDHPMVLEGIRSILSGADDVALLGFAGTAAEAMIFLQTHPVEIILLDINLPDSNGVELCKQIKEAYPSTRVLGISNFNDRVYITHLMRNGASGYVLKNASKDELLAAIRTVKAGKKYFSEAVADLLVQQTETPADKLPLLTRREKEVLALIAQGLTNPEIADRIFVSTLTVDSHRKNLLAKFGAKNTAALISFAAKHQLL